MSGGLENRNARKGVKRAENEGLEVRNESRRWVVVEGGREREAGGLDSGDKTRGRAGVEMGSRGMAVVSWLENSDREETVGVQGRESEQAARRCLGRSAANLEPGTVGVSH